MYVVGDRVILAFEPLVGQSGTVTRVTAQGVVVLLDAVGPYGLAVLALVGLEEPQDGWDLCP